MNVEELLIQKKIPFEIQGQDFKVKCLNPEHDDSNPSMRIDKITGIFHCFSCHYKGNLFNLFDAKANFLEIRRQLLKKKISESLASSVGLELPTNLMDFDRSWRDISASTYKTFEAFEHNDNDYIGRVVFPVRGISRKIQGFVGRALTPEKTPRYLVSPSKAKLPLHPANVVPYRNNVILVEGIFDMLNLYDKGVTNVVCSFGTSTVTKEKLALLKVRGVTTLDILFDNDEAGETSAKKVVDLADSIELATRIITLPKSVNDAGELTAQQVIKLKEALYG
jgi:DNA primase